MKKITFLFVALCATLFANATSISDALAAASSLADGKQTTERYSVSGKVVYASINTSYGNADFVIEDGSDLLYCWRTFDLDSAKFTAADKIAVGDSITVYGALKRYDALKFSAYPAYTSKIEMVYGYVTELNDEVVAIHNVEILDNIYANNGRIYTQDAARIYTITGLDVTSMNGNLEGVYIVKVANKVGKVMVTK